ncbi:GAF domain-containing sensor histidine kinase [Natronomonas gomsonensis]|nr:GAF domain-containing sensor histidine kinase [Natronomonas gomsonensis]
MRWMRLPLSGRTSTAVIFGFGASLAAVHAYHALSHETLAAGTVLGAVVPFGLAAALAAIPLALYRNDRNVVPIIAAWVLLGSATLGVVASAVVAHQFVEGVLVAEALFVVAASATGGGFLGGIAGWYDAQTRTRADLVESLQQATTDLSAATTQQEVCERAVEIANQVLDLPVTGVWLYDDEADALVPTAVANPGQKLFETPPTYAPGESLSWLAFDSGEMSVYDDVRSVDGVHNPDTVIRSEIIIPLGAYGVMNLGATEPNAFDDLDVTVAKLLATATRAALGRADREEVLRRQRHELGRQNERLEEFTSVVSHDLRSPLSVAKGRLDLARESHDDEDLEATADALDRMDSLIEDLLALAKQGRTVGDVRSVSLADIAETAWANVETAEATLSTTEATIDADPDRLRQLLENLFTNAVTHGGETVSVRVEPTEFGFAVTDDGPGIPSSVREQVFEAGYTDHESGTGFGLPIVRRIAVAHGWSVDIEESESGGARFEFRFDGDPAE